jgi:hypothetical protein
MSNMDDLLAKIKAEYEQKQKPQSSTSPLDNLVEQMQAEFQTSKTTAPIANNNAKDLLSRNSVSSGNSNVDNLLTDFQSSFQSKKSQQVNNPSLDPLVTQIKNEYQQKDIEEVEAASKANLEVIRQKELQEQRKRKALETKAQEWLKNLDPNSEEGLWFEEFSYAYETRLAAAIDYLDALGETRKLG